MTQGGGNNMDTVGVIGAGVMGIGVAQNLSQTGHRVILVDLTQELLDAAKDAVRQNLRMRGFFSKQKEQPEPSDAVMSRINFTCDYEELGNAGFIIENVVERWKV